MKQKKSRKRSGKKQFFDKGNFPLVRALLQGQLYRMILDWGCPNGSGIALPLQPKLRATMPRSPGPILQEPRPRLPATGAAMPTTRKDNSFTSWKKVPRDFPRAPKNTKFSGWRNCFFLYVFVLFCVFFCVFLCFFVLSISAYSGPPNCSWPQPQKKAVYRAENFAFQSRKLCLSEQKTWPLSAKKSSL